VEKTHLLHRTKLQYTNTIIVVPIPEVRMATIFVFLMTRSGLELRNIHTKYHDILSISANIIDVTELGDGQTVSKNDFLLGTIKSVPSR